MRPVTALYSEAGSSYVAAVDLKNAVRSKRWDVLQKSLEAMHGRTQVLITNIEHVRLLSFVPIVSGYYKQLPALSELEKNFYKLTTNVMTDLYPYHSILGFSVESEEEFDASVESLLKQSPQLVTVLKPYIAEI
ncbi:hypothetical protein KC614_05055, partial [candidate division WWE3 bacterium]|nr:hypothetical protein [candidate division WWE3 bacterium]